MEIEEALKEIETLKASNEKSGQDVVAMQTKMDELLSETKKAKAKAKEEEDASAAAARAQAEKDGNYQQLLKSSEELCAKTAAEFEDFKKSVEGKDISIAALEYALKCDPVNDYAAKDLAARHFESNMKMVDGKPRLLDKEGNLTMLSPEDYIKGLVASGEISHFIKGSQASGGGGDGNKGGGSAAAENPFKKGEHFNLTEQGNLLKTDPALASLLQSEA